MSHSRTLRALTVAAASLGATAALFMTPASAGEHLPPCNAPEGSVCLAIDNGSELDDIQLHSFRAPDGTCLVYKGGWGPGDTVGWPDVFVAAPYVNDDGVLVNAYPSVKGYSDGACGGGQQVSTSQDEGYMKNGYLVSPMSSAGEPGTTVPIP